MQQKFSLYDIIVIALMAAMVFVTTFFIKIEIPTPAGLTMLKIGNAVCLLSALLFGGIRGGLAAGIGSMFFDLLNPNYISSAPFTLVFFFLMAFICGKIAHSGGSDGKNTKKNILAGIVGACTYIVLSIGKSIITLMLAGSAFLPALIANSTKIATSSMNAIIAVSISVMLAPVLRIALTRAGIFSKLKTASVKTGGNQE